ncbi:GDSL esterase/lipase At5g03610 [Brachypodium distachyon]|uniref:SGNH hydrolase-type esterase domain-containing protein n=1 Tax=Brachypodium distachyon TaxID=15368 RepID=A0A0Q3LBK3_BRADI|nr:GDSL esterase/lipase At5g03610 [Brachypodium distachyon]KQJ89869.1 hypothetical protein BRADI_4g28226v3 [Brachypodium distachyon]|eukprot:XP_024310891.1 GDSL esterase/lipase At5g03610 [Brachypodium distachyon]
MKLFPAVGCLLLLIILNVAGVDSRGTPAASENKWTSLFVFGDDFADNGNLAKLRRGQTQPDSILQDTFRQWNYPYGSYVNSRGSATPFPTGRFSNYRIQADFVARILGLTQSPPAYMLTPDQTCDPSGMNLAFGGAGVSQVSKKAPTLAAQIRTFKRLVNDGIISKDQLRHSIALVAVSGNDYMSDAAVKDTFLNSFDDVRTYIANVTTEITKNVEQLQNLGVRKVLINNLHPIGCTPLHTESNNNTACDLLANYGAGQGSDQSKDFKRKLTPCCNRIHPTGYCGQRSASGEALYNLCQNPDNFFYWDEIHPTNAGWKAVMTALEQPLKELLDRDYVH